MRTWLSFAWQPPEDFSAKSILLAVCQALDMIPVDRPHQQRKNDRRPLDEERIQRCLTLIRGTGLRFLEINHELVVQLDDENLTFSHLHGKWGIPIEEYELIFVGQTKTRIVSERGVVLIPLSSLTVPYTICVEVGEEGDLVDLWD